VIAKVIIYRDIIGEWRLTAKAANGEPIVSSSEGYENRSWAIRVAREVFPDAELVDDLGDPIPDDEPEEDEPDATRESR
jgi:uncharacterized protein YegP (UPF0339 family)